METQETVTEIPGKGSMEKYRKMEEDLLRPIQKIGLGGKIWIGFLLVLCGMGLYAYLLQEFTSKYETINIRDYTMWGVYISNFVFFVALSLVGALVSAVLKLTNFGWHRPLTRIAEIIAVAAIILAGLNVTMAMGRPDRLHYLIIHGRIQSPIIWDVIVIMTYLTASLLFLYLPLLPGIAICRDKLTNKPKWQMWMYKTLAFGWKGTHEQWTIMKKCVKILAVFVIPLGVSIHTVTAWLFATTLRPEWDSTNLGVYFVAGAFLLGTAAVIVAAYFIRKYYKLEQYLTELHFDKLGKLLVFMSLIYVYFNINEYFVPAFKIKTAHANHLLEMFIGEEAFMYWMVVVFGMGIPILLPLFKKMRKPLPLTLIAIGAIIAAWFKRYLIVIPGLSHPYLPIQDVPENWKHYTPSLVETTIVVATIAATLLIVTLFSRFFPIISIWEVAEGEGVNLEEIHKQNRDDESVKKIA